MKFFPDLESYFDTIKEYRYSITVSLFVLCVTVSLFPHSLSGVTGTTTYAVGMFTMILMFSVSVGIILVKDFWPWLKDFVA